MKTFGKIKYVLLCVLMTLVCVCSAFVMTGCKKDGETEEFESVPVLTDTRSEEAEMVTMTNSMGDEITFNKNTRKIVALAGDGDLIALGIKPLAASIEESVTKMYKSYFEGVGYIDTMGGVDPEAVLSYHPDLILSTDSPMWYSQLKDIAPVVTIDYSDMDFESRLKVLTDIFGLEDNAKKLLDYAEDIKKEAVDKANELGLKDKTVTVFGTMMQGVTVMPGALFSWKYDPIVYEEFGMKKTQAVDEFLSDMDKVSGGMMNGISSEVLPNYEADYNIFMADTGEIPPTVLTNPGWLSLNAVKEDKVGVITSGLYAVKDILFLNQQYKELLTAFETIAAKA